MKCGVVVTSLMLGMGLTVAPITAARSEGLAAPASPLSTDVIEPASCEARPLSVDVARLKGTQGVLNVVADPANSEVTMLFASGDVLRIGMTGCTSALLTARLWMADRAFRTDASWIAKAKQITDLLLEPEQATQIDEALDAPTFERKPDGEVLITGAVKGRHRYSLTVLGRSTDNLGQSMSIIYFPR